MDTTERKREIAEEEMTPGLTRSEYLQFLTAVRKMGDERTYFLIKVFACIGLGVGELNYLTLESVKEGIVRLPNAQEKMIPDCLRKELLQYAKERKITSGTLFLTRSGTPLDRSNITNSIHRMALKAGMDPEKYSPRALNRMYQATFEEIVGWLEPMYIRSYENLLNMEQEVVAWQ